MPVNLTDADHTDLDRYLVHVLEAYRTGVMTQLVAVSELAHVIAAAAKGNPATMSHVRAVLKETGGNA